MDYKLIPTELDCESVEQLGRRKVYRMWHPLAVYREMLTYCVRVRLLEREVIAEISRYVNNDLLLQQ